jgi:transcription elongation factor Elf1
MNDNDSAAPDTQREQETCEHETEFYVCPRCEHGILLVSVIKLRLKHSSLSVECPDCGYADEMVIQSVP